MRCTLLARSARLASYRAKASSWLCAPTSLRQRASMAPSSMAMAAPWAMWGFMGWQASPSSTRRPRLHSGSGSRSSSDHLVTSTVASISAWTVGCQLLVMVDALKRASAERICAVIPYFGYARQDRRPRSTRVPITAKVVANMLQAVGVERVLTMDLHADQIQGFFDIPVDNIYATPVLLGDLRQKNYEDLIVVSPDVGGVVRARALAKQLGCDLAIIDKRRPKANVSEVMHVIGDFDGRNCVIMDDMIDTAGTLVKAAEVLKQRGAKSVYAYCTHPIFSGPAIERIGNGNALDEVVVTNTIPLSAEAQACGKIRQLSVAPLIAQTIQRISTGDSVLSLFSE